VSLQVIRSREPTLSDRGSFLHSGFRYLFLLAVVATIVNAVYGTVTKRPSDQRIRVLSVLTMLSLDFTSFLGVAFIFGTRTCCAGLGPHIATDVTP